MKTIFLAAPIEVDIDIETGLFNQRKTEIYSMMLKYLREKGYIVLNAHEREGWGENLASAEACTPIDFAGISDSDILIAFPGSPPSGGVHIEIGWASAMGKEIVLFLNENCCYSKIINGLHKICTVKYIYYLYDDEIGDKLRTLFED